MCVVHREKICGLRDLCYLITERVYVEFFTICAQVAGFRGECVRVKRFSDPQGAQRFRLSL